MRSLIIFAMAIVAIFCSPVLATIIKIPADYATIQAGIDASSNGDTVLLNLAKIWGLFETLI